MNEIKFGLNARTDVDFLRAQLATAGMRYELGWQWVGRERHGVLRIFKDISSSEALVSVLFRRNTWAWGSGDRKLGQVHTGSNRHLAVVAAIEQLKLHRGVLPPAKCS